MATEGSLGLYVNGMQIAIIALYVLNLLIDSLLGWTPGEINIDCVYANRTQGPRTLLLAASGTVWNSNVSGVERCDVIYHTL